MKLGISRKKCKEIPEVGDDVLMEVKPFIKDDRSFKSYIFAGKVRNSGRSKTGMTTYGMEFIQVGKRVFGNVSDLVWEDIDDSPMARDFKRAIIPIIVFFDQGPETIRPRFPFITLLLSWLPLFLPHNLLQRPWPI